LIPDEHRAGIDHPYAADIAFGQLDGQRQGVRILPESPLPALLRPAAGGACLRPICELRP